MHLNASTRLHVHVHLSLVVSDSKELLPECSVCVNKALIKHNSCWYGNFSLEAILIRTNKLCSRLLRRHARWMRLLQVRDMNKLHSRASVHHLECVKKLTACACSHSSYVVILSYLSLFSVGIPSFLVSQQLLCHVHRKAFVHLL